MRAKARRVGSKLPPDPTEFDPCLYLYFRLFFCPSLTSTVHSDLYDITVDGLGLQGGPKSDTSRTYITLYERYHFFGPPGICDGSTPNNDRTYCALIIIIVGCHYSSRINAYQYMMNARPPAYIWRSVFAAGRM